MPEPHLSATPRRSDATENRARIIAVARDAFADSDVDISMAEVSRRAGVGMATLYRNFADRRELLEAVYTDEVDAICASAATVSGDSDGARLDAWLREFFRFVTSKRRVAAGLLEHTDRTDSVFGNSRARVYAAGVPLLHAAQSSRQVRDDLDLDQILDMVHAIATLPGDARATGPVLQTVLDGLHYRE